jgi:hypothetical protein
MGKLNRVIACVALLCACSSRQSPPSEVQSTTIPRAKAALDKRATDPRLDAEGNLRPGSLKVGWFEIPLGFERIAGSTERVGNFEAAGITPAQLRQYVTARGQSTQVEYMTHGELYPQLAPTHTQLPVPPVDVSILFVDTRTNKLRLVVEDRTPTEPDLTPQQAMDKLAKARERIE